MKHGIRSIRSRETIPTVNMKLKNAVLLVGCILFAQLAGAIGSIANLSSLETWYAALNKPALNPPNWVFGPVWTTLFLLMGISLYLILRHRRRLLMERRGFKLALALFAAQWILNIAWSFLFFYFQQPLWAFAEIILLLASIVATIIAFYKLYRPAAYLLLPYLFWVCFASWLNLSIWLLN